MARTVAREHLASSWGSGLADVLATPALVAYCEECARLAVDTLLPEGQQTVGTRINLRHLAATPAGLSVRIRAELIERDNRRLVFSVQAWDPAELIGTGEHERFIIDSDRFSERLAAKRQLSDSWTEV